MASLPHVPFPDEEGGKNREKAGLRDRTAKRTWSIQEVKDELKGVYIHGHSCASAPPSAFIPFSRSESQDRAKLRVVAFLVWMMDSNVPRPGGGN